MKKLIILGGIIALIVIVWMATKDESKPLPIQEDTDNSVPLNSISDGLLKLEYPSIFGLAVKKDQILAESYIPPCDDLFDYCLYYYGSDFDGTNFESAGIRIYNRMGLTSTSTCLYAPKEGYPNLAPSSTSTSSYAASIFSPIGDAAAGHFASGEEYRLFVGKSCYEIETRIGETQYANYEEGTVRKFEEKDRDLVYKYFNTILGNLSSAYNNERIILPASEN